MADSHSAPDTDHSGTERSLIVGYRPNVFDESTPKIILSGKWLRAAGFDTGQQVTVKVMKGCIVLVAYNEQEQRLQDDFKRPKAKLNEIEDALAAIQTPRPGKWLANVSTNHRA
ncbi:SymE family type I addiction module toxin [Enterobacter roggenkampii]|uniref:SymE family type I addiction module toxin n=1 Tax=Enterobacter roggenkampii TaxID=1812935 RepID=UPI001C642372|nr:SymE family type I addiction module toxin [Enterobacter roggenkampii]MBW7681264.1 SymE family type I addiction module toxin [Enterobacter roggenkampii]MCK7071408.1 SymE family type I addiction module toxin [Enterobacter roggenkampii]MCK7093954.1 SymE family type I addiction module toxin [Enterobacter roggenkampii]MCK7408057.1 SymE family type I addiction module toxin [Enterobacter roggenkampii]WJS51148.1 SymE family type I addiction module toxin [Enterobacter roggenkampii]